MKPKRYRLQLTLDEEMYKEIADFSRLIGLGMATTARMILCLGFDISKRIDKKTLNDLNKAIANEEDMKGEAY